MADEAEVTENKGPNIIVVVLITMIGTLILSLGGLYATGMLGQSQTVEQSDPTTVEKSQEMSDPEAPDRVIVELFSGMITLKDNKHLSFRLVADLAKDEEPQLTKHLEAIQNMIILYVSDMTEQNFEGRRGKMKALEEIKIRVDTIIRERKLKIKVNDLYLTKFELP